MWVGFRVCPHKFKLCLPCVYPGNEATSYSGQLCVCVCLCVQVGKGGKGNYSLVFRLTALRRGRAINFIHGIKVYMN